VVLIHFSGDYRHCFPAQSPGFHPAFYKPGPAASEQGSGRTGEFLFEGDKRAELFYQGIGRWKKAIERALYDCNSEKYQQLINLTCQPLE